MLLFILLIFVSFASAFWPFDFVKKVFGAKVSGQSVQGAYEISLLPASCNDSDGGIFPYAKGNVSYVLNNRTRSVVDVCLSTGYGYGGEYLREHYCNNSALKSVNIFCKDGCANGACVNASLMKCVDSDGGRNYTLKGNVTKGDVVKTDFCDGNVLKEYYCDNRTNPLGIIKNVSYNCTRYGYSGCEDGMCVKKEIENKCLETSPSFNDYFNLIKKRLETYGDKFVLQEGAEIESDNYAVIYLPNINDKARIINVGHIPIGSFNELSRIYLRDVTTGEILFYLGDGLTVSILGHAEMNIAGYQFYFKVNNETIIGSETVRITWGENASYGDVGVERDIFNGSCILRSKVGRASLVFNITDALTEEGISNAIVTLTENDENTTFTNKTDNWGIASFLDIPFIINKEGKYTINLTINKSGYYAKNFEVNVSISKNNFISIPLEYTSLKICTDSDGGKNYTWKGNVTRRDVVKTDFCDGNVLREYYCDNGTNLLEIIRNISYNCTHHGYFKCENGRCANINISIATLKDQYKIGEKIKLTDPPDDENIDDDLDLISTSLINQKKEPKIRGYIIEFEESPLIVRDIELKKEMKGNQEYIQKTFVLNPKRISKQLFSITKPEQVKKEVSKQKAKLKEEHKILKESISRKVGAPLSEAAGNVGITAQAVDEPEQKNIQVLGEWDSVFNGIALDINAEEAEKVAKIQGVKSVFPDYEVRALLQDSVPLIGADKVWELDKDLGQCTQSGKDCLTGEGVTIAVIDTGVDYTHPNLGNSIVQKQENNYKKVTQEPILDLQRFWGGFPPKLLALDNNRILYSRNCKLYLYHFENNQTEILKTASKACPDVFTMDGDYIIYTATIGNNPFISKLYLFDLKRNDNYEIKDLSNLSLNWLSYLSGNFLAYAYNNGTKWCDAHGCHEYGNFDSFLVLFDILTKKEIIVEQNNISKDYKSPLIDQNILVYEKYDSNSIFIYNITSGEKRNISFPQENVAPLIDFKEDKIIYSSLRGGFFITDIFSGELQTISVGDSVNSLVNFSGSRGFNSMPFYFPSSQAILEKEFVFFGGDSVYKKIYVYDKSLNKTVNVNHLSRAGDFVAEKNRICWFAKDFNIYCHEYNSSNDYTMPKPVFNSKVVGGYDFFNHNDNPMDDNGHGTHVASIAAGKFIEYNNTRKEGDLLRVGDSFILGIDDTNESLRNRDDNTAREFVFLDSVYYPKQITGERYFQITFKDKKTFNQFNITCMLENESFYSIPKCPSFNLSEGFVGLDFSLPESPIYKIFVKGNSLYFSDLFLNFLPLAPVRNFPISITWGEGSDYNKTGNVTSYLTKTIRFGGVAPNAKIIAYKVLDEDGSAKSSVPILDAINRATDPNGDGNFSDHVDIISMSLGGPGSPDDPKSQAVNNAVDAGIVVVVAAGNSGPGGNNFCRNEKNPTGAQYSICSPGTAKKAITVGATDKADHIADYSSRGPVVLDGADEETNYLQKPDVVAPGSSICAASLFESNDACLFGDSKHVRFSGTSMAAPHVAGAIALLKQKNPLWGPDELKRALENTSISLNYNITDEGYGRINTLDAIKLKEIAIDHILNRYEPQSKITNDGDSDISGNLSIYIQKNTEGQWANLEGKSIVDYPANVLGKGLVKLDAIFNPRRFSLNEAGDYRIYAVFEDSAGNKKEASWEFEVV
jgi:subtilisin family serine protease